MAVYQNSYSSIPNPLGINNFSQFFSSPTYFPQPSGSVYNINNALEIANVPVGAGMSIALCLPESTMYIKSMQNGNPVVWSYQISQYTSNSPKEDTSAKAKEQAPAPIPDKTIEEIKQKYTELEKKLDKIIKDLGGK